MSARTLSEVNRAQEAQIETLLGMVRDLASQNAAVLAALTAPRTSTASESVTLSRSKLADKATGIDVQVVPQEGETLEDAVKRGATIFEASAARYPLPDGSAHAAPLGDDLKAKLTASVEGLRAVPDPEETK